MEAFYERKRELELIREFINKPGSQLTYLRGRRRVGKSALLKWLHSRTPHSFYFPGAQDSTLRQTLRDFAFEWDKVFPESRLSRLNIQFQNWGGIFEEITRQAQKSSKPVILLFDEIQWIAKERSGFVGRLKAAWDDWKKTGKVKLVLCGSSNSFFHKKTGGEEKILRGLKTFSEIWVRPFTLKEIKKYYFKNWSYQEICLCAMMIGGIPYYLEQIPHEDNFIRAINQTFFTRSTIFLDEVDEVLSLEFHQNSKETVKTILSSLGPYGAAQKTIEEKTGLPRPTLYDNLAKLIDYKIIVKETPLGLAFKKNDAGARYWINDFYLNFYFRILEGLSLKIKKNKRGLLFPHECLASDKGYYIPQFTGPGFEKLVRFILEDSLNLEPALFHKLHLGEVPYRVGTFWNAQTQIDLVVESRLDRESRLVECKWQLPHNIQTDSLLTEILDKKYPRPKGYQTSYFLVLSEPPSDTFVKKAADRGVKLVFLEDLF